MGWLSEGWDPPIYDALFRVPTITSTTPATTAAVLAIGEIGTVLVSLWVTCIGPISMSFFSCE